MSTAGLAPWCNGSLYNSHPVSCNIDITAHQGRIATIWRDKREIKGRCWASDVGEWGTRGPACPSLTSLYIYNVCNLCSVTLLALNIFLWRTELPWFVLLLGQRSAVLLQGGTRMSPLDKSHCHPMEVCAALNSPLLIQQHKPSAAQCCDEPCLTFLLLGCPFLLYISLRAFEK